MQILPEQGAHYIELTVERDRCYSFVAVAEETLEDLDLHVYGEGTELAENSAVDNFPVVHWCNHLYASVSIELRAYTGFGRCLFQAFVYHPDAEAGTHPLRAALDALGATYAEGFLPAAQPMLDELPTGGENTFDVLLAGGRCYVIAAAGDATVTDLDLLLYAPAGDLAEASLDAEAPPVLRPCLDQGQGGRYRLLTRMTAGFGDYGVVIFGN